MAGAGEGAIKAQRRRHDNRIVMGERSEIAHGVAVAWHGNSRAWNLARTGRSMKSKQACVKLELLDLDQPLIVEIDGKRIFEGRVERKTAVLAESLAQNITVETDRPRFLRE